MMADAPLTSLCGICHTKSPRYKCPRCGARTCSLSCVKKHKNWSSCNGERDATAYVAPARLRTDAGIDHDYNFLTKIERSMERVEKVLAEEKGVLPPPSIANTSLPPPNKRARLHKGRSRGRTTIVQGTREWPRPALRRLANLDIAVKHVPFGMTRGKENTTSWNKRKHCVNWQVEWFLLEPGSFSGEQGALPSLTRFLNKISDLTPLAVGFADCQEEHRRMERTAAEKRKEIRQARKQRLNEETPGDRATGGNSYHEAAGQDPDTAAWSAAPAMLQNAKTGAWQKRVVSTRQSRIDNLAEEAKGMYRFFFHISGTPSREPRKLIPVGPTDTLAGILSGEEVLEFPTIYVLPAGASFPDGYVLSTKKVMVETPARAKDEDGDKTRGHRFSSMSKKRKRPSLVEYASSNDDGEVEEGDHGEQGDAGEGQASEDGEVQDQDDSTSSSGSDSD